METGLSDRVTLELGAGERGTIGLRALFGQNRSGSVRFLGGLDGLITSGEDHLNGVESQVGEGSRLWARSAWANKRFSASGGLAAKLENGSAEWTPSAAASVHMNAPLPLSFGWEGQFEKEDFRQSIGIGAAWKQLSLGIGLSELQSWVCQKGKWGWFGTPPAGASDGRNNPGVWMRISWTIPGVFTHVNDLTGRSVSNGSEDHDQITAIDAALTRKSVRRDLAELTTIDEENPAQRALLRRQILSGGEVARQELWRVALSAQFLQPERLQAIATLDNDLLEDDAASLARLAKDPDAQIRVAAARELLRLDNPLAKTTLEQLASDPDSGVRSTASLGVPAAPVAPSPSPTPAATPDSRAPAAPSHEEPAAGESAH